MQAKSNLEWGGLPLVVTDEGITLVGDFDTPECQEALAAELQCMWADTCKTPGLEWHLFEGTNRQLIEYRFMDQPIVAEKDGMAITYAVGTKGYYGERIRGGKAYPEKQYYSRVQSRIYKVTAIAMDVDGTDHAHRVAARCAGRGLLSTISTTHGHDAKRTNDGEYFRVIIFLEEPFVFPLDDPDARRHAVTEYRAFYAGVLDLLGIQEVDGSALNLHQMMYTPRRPSAESVFEQYIIAGRLLRRDDVVPGDPTKFTSKMTAGGQNRLALSVKGSTAVYLSDGFDIREWYFDGGKFFFLSDLLDILGWAVYGDTSGGWVGMQCPNNAEHSDPNDTTGVGFIESDEGFGINCFHGHCEHLKTFEFLQLIEQAILNGEVMLPNEYETLSQLLCDASFYPDEIDGEEVHFEPADYGVLEKIDIQFLGSSRKVDKAFSAVSKNENAGDDHFAALYAGVERAGNKTRAVQKLKELIEGHGLHDGNARKRLAKRGSEMLKDARDAYRAEKLAEEHQRERSEDVEEINTDDGFTPTVEKVIEVLSNVPEPLLYAYMDGLADIRIDQDGVIRIKVLNVGGLKEVASRVIEFVESKRIGKTVIEVSAAPPHDVFDNIYHQPPDDFAVKLRGVANAPFLTRNGTMVTQNGYHADSKLFLHLPDALAGLDVPDHPTAEEAKNAARFIVEEVLGDFPVGGLLDREEILKRVFEGDGVAAVANYLAMVLQQFMREMINGPTPLFVFNKPAPGTGAGLAVDVASIITTGEDAPSWAMPRNKEEIAKTLTTALADGVSIINFDNIDEGVDSAELAMAITQRIYMARILQRTEAVRVDVRCTFSGTANHLTMSPELIRRSVLIDLNAHHANPEERVPEGGWRHRELKEWVTEHRGKLVTACLTIIRHWIAEGMETDPNARMGSFEAWAGIMGGVLSAAGVKGFLGNRDDLWSETLDNTTDALAVLLTELAGYPDGTKFKAGELMEILNAGWEATNFKPHLIPGFGYATVDGETRYFNAVQIGKQFKKVAKKPWRVSVAGKMVEASFAGEKDRTDTMTYTMTKKDAPEK